MDNVDTKDIKQQIKLILNLTPKPNTKLEREIWIKQLLSEKIGTNFDQALFKFALKELEKNESIVEKSSSNDIYRPLCNASEKFSAISFEMEQKLFSLVPIIIDELQTIITKTIETNTSEEKITNSINKEIGLLINNQGYKLNDNETKILTQLIHDNIYKLGPLELLLRDSEIADILVNSPNQVFIEKKGKLILTSVKFYSKDHLLNTIKKIATLANQSLTLATPYIDTKLADGSRVNAIIPPLALDSPILSIRKFQNERLTLNSMVTNASLSTNIASFLSSMVHSRLNILISGGTGSGKTTLLNALSWAIEENSRVVTIEDSAELQLKQQHVVRLETRSKSSSNSTQITQKELLQNALRMRPDRIIIGEIRGAEAFDLLQAMNTGHDGSMSTIHANTASDAVNRLINLVSMADLGISENFIKSQISQTIDLIVQIERSKNGSRKITSISQLFLKNNEIVVEPIFSLEFKKDKYFLKRHKCKFNFTSKLEKHLSSDIINYLENLC